jgi:hypothetical protein
MFMDQMPDVMSAKQLTVYRARPNKPVSGMIAGKPVRTKSHWFKGRTLPCLATEHDCCPLCVEGIPVRYYVYYPLRNAKGAAAIVELTATAEAELVDYLRTQPADSIPCVKVYRAAGKKNNPVHCEVEFKPCSKSELLAFERVKLDVELIRRTLTRLWNLPHWPEGMNLKDFTDITRKHITQVLKGNI